MAYLPCTNPSCRNYGKSHPNCKDYDDLSSTEKSNLEAQGYELPGVYRGGSTRMAKGGKVICSEASEHHDECHFAEGGVADLTAPSLNETVGHAAIGQGLHSLLTKAGQTNAEPEKQHEDYQASAKRGKKALERHMGSFLGKQKASDRLEADKGSREALKAHINDLEEDPGKMFHIGMNLNPEHATQLAAHAAGAFTYLKGLKPKPMQASPLDTPTPPDKAEEAHYNRHLDIAQNPLHVLQHVSDGTLQPQDLQTLKTIYPHLSDSMSEKATGSLIDARFHNKEIPHKQLSSLSMLMGSPLDSIDKPEYMQAIIQSQAGQANQRAQQPKKETAAELETIRDVDKLSETSLQARQINKNKD